MTPISAAAGASDCSVVAQVVLDSARALERVPELLGIGPHLIATARRPVGLGERASSGET